MNRKNIKAPKDIPHFIGCWEITSVNICDEIIHNFENTNKSKQVKGVIGSGLKNSESKDSQDLSLSPNDLWQPGNKVFTNYLEFLTCCYKDYVSQWPFLRQAIPSVDVGIFNIQRYEAGQHFNKIHTERTFGSLEREFAFMTYLNDVSDGGSTYFKHYDIQIQPKKGLTLIWPATWTHAHKGNTVKSGKKYIITGWLDLC